jgi:uncharacterized protein
LRAVLDPNVLISALLSPTGAPAALLRRWLEGEFELVISEMLLAKLARAFAYPKLRSRFAADDANAFIDLLRRSAKLFDDPPISGSNHATPGTTTCSTSRSRAAPSS